MAESGWTRRRIETKRGSKSSCLWQAITRRYATTDALADLLSWEGSPGALVGLLTLYLHSMIGGKVRCFGANTEMVFPASVSGLISHLRLHVPTCFGQHTRLSQSWILSSMGPSYDSRLSPTCISAIAALHSEHEHEALGGSSSAESSPDDCASTFYPSVMLTNSIPKIIWLARSASSLTSL